MDKKKQISVDVNSEEKAKIIEAILNSIEYTPAQSNAKGKEKK
jgi:hypothetical protein